MREIHHFLRTYLSVTRSKMFSDLNVCFLDTGTTFVPLLALQSLSPVHFMALYLFNYARNLMYLCNV